MDKSPGWWIGLARLEERLRKVLRGRRFKLFLARLRVAEETGNSSWLYHVLGALYRDYYGGDTRYPLLRASTTSPFLQGVTVDLPEPRMESGVDTLEAIRSRISRRSYRGSLTLQNLSDVLYYSVGVRGPPGGMGLREPTRARGALQLVEAYVIAEALTAWNLGSTTTTPGATCSS